MRPIIFRGKTVDGEWVFGDLIKGNLGVRIREEFDINPTYNNPAGGFKTLFHDVNCRSVGQFIGLYDATTWEELTEEERDKSMCPEKDWKGKPIYEGDILGFKTTLAKGFSEENMDVYLKVVYGRHNPDCDSLSHYIGFWTENVHGHRSSIQYYVDSHNAKVIGNIYDNEDLMSK